MLRSASVVCIAAIGILFLSSDFAFAQDLSRQAKIIFVKGDAKVQKALSAEWLAAKEGMILTEGDSARTGRASLLEIAFDMESKNVLRIEENSTAILKGKWLRQVELPQGRVRCLVRKLRKDSSFEVRTPTSVAGARGSGWEVETEEERDNIKVQEDEIFVQSFDEEGNLIKEMILTEGWETDIERFQAPSEMIEISDADRRDWDSWREDLDERIEIERAPEKEEAPKAGGGAEAPAGGAGENLSGAESIGEITDERGDYKEETSQTVKEDEVDTRASGGSTETSTTSEHSDPYAY